MWIERYLEEVEISPPEIGRPTPPIFHSSSNVGAFPVGVALLLKELCERVLALEEEQ